MALLFIIIIWIYDLTHSGYLNMSTVERAAYEKTKRWVVIDKFPQPESLFFSSLPRYQAINNTTMSLCKPLLYSKIKFICTTDLSWVYFCIPPLIIMVHVSTCVWLSVYCSVPKSHEKEKLLDSDYGSVSEDEQTHLIKDSNTASESIIDVKN